MHFVCCPQSTKRKCEIKLEVKLFILHLQTLSTVAELQQIQGVTLKTTQLLWGFDWVLMGFLKFLCFSLCFSFKCYIRM